MTEIDGTDSETDESIFERHSDFGGTIHLSLFLNLRKDLFVLTLSSFE